MHLDQYITKSRIIDLKSITFGGVIEELLQVTPYNGAPNGLTKSALLELLLDREKTMTTCLGNGVAIPHIRVNMKRPYLFALGRCSNGLDYDEADEYKNIRYVFLLLASNIEKSYLNVLASIARLFQDRTLIKHLSESKELRLFREQVIQAFGGVITRSISKMNPFNQLILKKAQKIAKGAKCESILIFGDTFSGGIDLAHALTDFKTILVTQSHLDYEDQQDHLDDYIVVRSFSNSRLSQLRSAILIGLTRGMIKHNERLCCIAGIPKSNQFDTLVVVEVEKEFQFIFNQDNMLPANIKAEVLERVVAIATELGVEGREGKPVGCMFVIGDIEQIRSYIKPLVLNPFYGYKEEERNLLNPFMDETLKEFSSIDGAFIIRGDGVVESAGSLVHAPASIAEMPSGYGSRHSAAAAISRAVDCIAITVSSSGGQVNIFRNGQMLSLVERSIERLV